MTKVAVILESDGHGVKDSVHAALTLAAAFGSVITLTTSPAETVLDACARYGAARIITVTGPGDLSLRPDLRATAFAECIKAEDSTDVIAIHSMEGKDTLARIAVELSAAFVGDCLGIDVAARSVKKSYFAGKVLASLGVPGEVALYGLRPNALPAMEKPSQSEKGTFTASVEDFTGAVTVIETLGGGAGSADLSEATVIVSGGRAMGDAKQFRHTGSVGRETRSWRGRIPRGRGCRIRTAYHAGRADREDRESEPLHRLRHFRRGAALRGHQDRKGHRGNQ